MTRTLSRTSSDISHRGRRQVRGLLRRRHRRRRRRHRRCRSTDGPRQNQRLMIIVFAGVRMRMKTESVDLVDTQRRASTRKVVPTRRKIDWICESPPVSLFFNQKPRSLRDTRWLCASYNAAIYIFMQFLIIIL